jgi:hypothetical protein
MGGARTRRTAVALAAAFGLTSMPVFAQSPEGVAHAPPEEAVAEGPLPRARGSVGGLAGGSSFYNGSFNGNVDVVGFYLRAGIQWSHGFGTELEGAAASSVLTSSVHAGMFVDLSTVDWFSVAVGPVIGASYALDFPSQCLGCPPPNRGAVMYVAGAARLDVFAFSHRSAHGVRGLDLGVEVQVGEDTGSVPANESSFGLAGYVMIGYAAY